ncbi:hypothetical protein EJ04DRAFT_557628 [Polyplosphaeria fusca]|uniref:Uncharacterized protein n=1 Tax=Polyplosphaeria fusca TaxID=682080 RepID=A0A9P4QLJ9_9PLEO|nr:hypothetical protein EJ04DRAFT_557628 [Polyplosphaeria fusca]
MSLLDRYQPFTLLRACMSTRIKAADIIESLGLKNGNPGRAAPIFEDADVKALYESIGNEVKKITGGNIQTPTQILDDLSKSEVLRGPVDSICKKFGNKIWGRQKRAHLLESKSKPQYPKDLYWDQDCNAIRHYIRCWIVKRAHRKIGDAQRKLRDANADHMAPASSGKQKKNFPVREILHVLSDDDEDSENESVQSLPDNSTRLPNGNAATSTTTYQAPPAVMQPPPVPEADPMPRHALQASQHQVHVVDLDENAEEDSLYADPPPRSSNLQRVPSVPSCSRQDKRKRPGDEDNGELSPGKLPKVSAWRQTMAELPKDRLEYPFAIPRSPSTVFAAEPFPTLFGRRRRNNRAATQESDASYRPSSRGSVESEEDIDVQIGQTIETIYRDVRATETPVSPQDPAISAPVPMTPDVPRDSVIPADVGDTEITPAAPCPQPIDTITAGRRDSISQSSPLFIPGNSAMLDEVPQNERSLRRELFKLLLSRLSNLQEFSSITGIQSHEARLNGLLNNFWANDQGQLRVRFGPRYPALDKALKKWIDMREQLTRFRASTDFQGRPGYEWRIFLQGLGARDNTLRAKAVLAYWNLGAVEFGDLERATFDEDLKVVFDALTKFQGCCGAEEFGAVGAYNKVLVSWYRCSGMSLGTTCDSKNRSLYTSFYRSNLHFQQLNRVPVAVIDVMTSGLGKRKCRETSVKKVRNNKS